MPLERYPFGGACSVRPEPGVGVDALWSRPGAVPAFEREPGALEEEPGGAAWECVEWELELVCVVVVVGVAEVAVLDGAGDGTGVCVALAPPPPVCDPLPVPVCDEGAGLAAERWLAPVGPLRCVLLGVATVPVDRVVSVTPLRVTRSPGFSVGAFRTAARCTALSPPPIRGSPMPATGPNPNVPSTRATSHSPTSPAAMRPASRSARGRAGVVAANTGLSPAGITGASAGCGRVSGSAVAWRVISRDTNALNARRLGSSPLADGGELSPSKL